MIHVKYYSAIYHRLGPAGKSLYRSIVKDLTRKTMAEPRKKIEKLSDDSKSQYLKRSDAFIPELSALLQKDPLKNQLYVQAIDFAKSTHKINADTKEMIRSAYLITEGIVARKLGKQRPEINANEVLDYFDLFLDHLRYVNGFTQKNRYEDLDALAWNIVHGREEATGMNGWEMKDKAMALIYSLCHKAGITGGYWQVDMNRKLLALDLGIGVGPKPDELQCGATTVEFAQNLPWDHVYVFAYDYNPICFEHLRNTYIEKSYSSSHISWIERNLLDKRGLLDLPATDALGRPIPAFKHADIIRCGRLFQHIDIPGQKLILKHINQALREGGIAMIANDPEDGREDVSHMLSLYYKKHGRLRVICKDFEIEGWNTSSCMDLV